MKKLYTSNYARNSRHPKAISISANAPRWFKGPSYPDLAPTWDFLMDYKNGIINDAEYTKRYMTLLTEGRSLDPQKVVDDMQDGAVMLCYESPSDFCHRHIVAKWLMENTDVVVEELLEKTPKKQAAIVDELLVFEDDNK